MSAPEQAETSPVKELERRLGADWHNLSDAGKRADEERRRLQDALVEQSSDDVSIVAFGSLARREFTQNSDVDWTALVDGLANPNHVGVAHKIEAKLADLGAKEPGIEGTFGNLAFSHALVNRIGGEDDTNKNTTQRILLLLESVPIGRREAYDRVIRNVLRRYLEEDGTYSRRNARYLVPRFLLNDIARYWRTVAVDFAYKRKSRLGEGAALRNLKLRMSRKLIYASGLLTCFGCELELVRQDLCEAPRDAAECVTCLE